MARIPRPRASRSSAARTEHWLASGKIGFGKPSSRVSTLDVCTDRECRSRCRCMYAGASDLARPSRARLLAHGSSNGQSAPRLTQPRAKLSARSHGRKIGVRHRSPAVSTTLAHPAASTRPAPDFRRGTVRLGGPVTMHTLATKPVLAQRIRIRKASRNGLYPPKQPATHVRQMGYKQMASFFQSIFLHNPCTRLHTRIARREEPGSEQRVLHLATVSRKGAVQCDEMRRNATKMLRET